MRSGVRTAKTGILAALCAALAVAVLLVLLFTSRGGTPPAGNVPYGLSPQDVSGIIPQVTYVLNFSKYVPIDSPQLAPGGYMGMYTESFMAQGTNDTSQYPYSIESDVVMFSNSSDAAAYVNSIVAYDRVNGTVQGRLDNGTYTQVYSHGSASTVIYTSTSVALTNASLIQPNAARAIYYSTSFFSYCSLAGIVVADGYIGLEWNVSVSMAQALFDRVSNQLAC